MVNDVTIKLYPDAWGRVTTQAKLEAVTRLGNRVLNNSRQRVNVDTGNLRSSGRLHIEGTADPVCVVGYYTRYALAVHDGSRPHIIRPSRSGVLAWSGPDGVVFARMVHHPGYTGNPFLDDALTEETARF